MRLEQWENGADLTTQLIISSITMNMTGTYRCESELDSDTADFGRYLSQSVRLNVTVRADNEEENLILDIYSKGKLKPRI